MKQSKKNRMKYHRCAYEIVEMGASADWAGHGYDIIGAIVLPKGNRVILYSQEHITNQNVIKA